VPLAESLDDFPGFAKVVSGHQREQMVLDLIVANNSLSPTSPKWSASPLQAPKDFPLRLEHAGLVVGDRVTQAESFHDFLSFTQLVTGHVGKQVVLDLIVEPSVH
jgi:hypothetical protein